MIIYYAQYAICLGLHRTQKTNISPLFAASCWNWILHVFGWGSKSAVSEAQTTPCALGVLSLRGEQMRERMWMWIPWPWYFTHYSKKEKGIEHGIKLDWQNSVSLLAPTSSWELSNESLNLKKKQKLPSKHLWLQERDISFNFLSMFNVCATFQLPTANPYCCPMCHQASAPLVVATAARTDSRASPLLQFTPAQRYVQASEISGQYAQTWSQEARP